MADNSYEAGRLRARLEEILGRVDGALTPEKAADLLMRHFQNVEFGYDDIDISSWEDRHAAMRQFYIEARVYVATPHYYKRPPETPWEGGGHGG